ncbi:UNVERIFIED_CONTAM: hypothetical protein HDU68_001763 [Siphonaria sp. JEL0065]|nr:hypothetical protein HDU68_001763 [Siphonaria sp. JEL0065]
MRNTRPLTLFSLLLSLLVHQSLADMWCYPSGSKVDGTGKPAICIGAHDLGSGSTEYTLFSSVSGWIGFGLASAAGDSMGPADVMVAYLDSSNSVQVSSFLTTGPGALSNNPTKPWSLVELNTTIPQPSWAPLAVSVTKPNAATGTGEVALTLGKKGHFIFCWANAKVKVGNGGSISMTAHGDNHTAVDATVMPGGSSIMALPSGISFNTIVLAHASIMIFALVLMPPLGSFVAMFMREKLRTGWMAVHLGIMIGGVGVLSIIGAVIMILFSPGPLFKSIHDIAGVAIIFLLFVQFGIGAGARSASDSSSIISQAHKYIGLIITYLFVPAQLYLGFTQYNTVFGTMAPIWLIGMAGFFALCGIGALVYGYFMLPYGEPGLRGLSNSGLGSSGGVDMYSGNGYQKSRRDFVELDGYGPEAKRSGSRNGAGSATGRSGSRNHHGGGHGNDYYGGAQQVGGNDYYGGAYAGGQDYYGGAAAAPPPQGNDYYAGGGAAGGGADYNYASHAPRDPSRDYNATRKAPSRNAAGGGAASSNGHYDPFAPAATPSRAATGGGNYPGTTPARNPSRTRNPSQGGRSQNRGEY